MRVNFSSESSQESSSGVTRPWGVTPCRFSNRLAIQCVSRVMAICRWASIIRLRSVVPDLGHPTMNTYGFIASQPFGSRLPEAEASRVKDSRIRAARASFSSGGGGQARG